MKLNEILIEAPLPDDWDKETYSPNVSFAKRIKYAQERAKKLGTGSSRVAFEIEYKGRPTVLKVAKNKKGMAQNEAEVEFLDDGYLESLGILIPLIDYDEKNNMPTWIHTEKAAKIKKSDFKKYTGLTLDEILSHTLYLSGKSNMEGFISAKDYSDKIKNEDAEDFINSIADMIGNFDIPIGDFSRTANWGVYKGKPVIIDVGLSKDVYNTHYKL